MPSPVADPDAISWNELEASPDDAIVSASSTSTASALMPTRAKPSGS
jgi:hypothetical protein